MVAMGVIAQEDVTDPLVIGELSLDGMIAPVAGVLSAALHASSQQARYVLNIMAQRHNGPQQELSLPVPHSWLCFIISKDTASYRPLFK